MFYLDTSFIVPYFLPEAASAKVEAFLRRFESGLAVSQWTRTEFASAVGIKCRTGQISRLDGERALDRFQEVVTAYFVILQPQEQDFLLAAAFLKQWELGLRAGDALHLAIAANHRVECLYSLDSRLIHAAGQLNLPASLGI